MVKDSVSLSVVTDRLKASIEVKHHKDRHKQQNVLILFYIYKTGGTVPQWQQGWTDYIAWQIKLSLFSK